MSEKKSFGRTKALKALIIFVAVLALLTFFSNTIMNYFIPKVVGSYISRGNLSTDNRATAQVELKNGAVIKGLEGRIVSEVLVSNYDEVKKGDVIIKLEEIKDDSQISEIKTELTSLEREQKYYEMQKNSSDYSSLNMAIKQASQNLEDANKTLKDSKNKKKIIDDAKKVIDTNSPKAISLQSQVDSASGTIESLSADKSKIEGEIKKIENQLLVLETNGNEIPEKVKGLSSDYEKNTPEYFVALKQEKEKEVSELENSISEAQSRLDSASTKLSDVNQKIEDAKTSIENANQLPSVKEAQSQVDSAKAELASAKKSLSDTKNQDKVSSTQAKDQEKDRLKKIEELKTKISDLEESFKSDEIISPCDGYIYDLAVDSGDELTKDVIATIIPDKKECMVSFSFTKSVSMGLYVGQVLECDDNYVEKCTISKIKPDPENPQENALIICDLEGDLWPGHEITVTLSRSNSDYEQIVPASAINEDNGGEFVYAIVKESSVLGDKYNVNRIDVSVLATDGFKTAVAGEGLEDAYMIVTRSDEPLENGQRVRLTDYSNKDSNN